MQIFVLYKHPYKTEYCIKEINRQNSIADCKRTVEIRSTLLDGKI